MSVQIEHVVFRFIVCHKETAEVSTQTEIVVFTCPSDSEQSDYFKRGTFQHTMVQRKINAVIDKYQLRSQKDLSFGRAVIELITSFPDLEFSTATEQKMRLRLGKAIRWTKFAQKKREQKKLAAQLTKPEESAEPTEETTIEVVVEPQPEPPSTETGDSDSDDEILANLQYAARKDNTEMMDTGKK